MINQITQNYSGKIFSYEIVNFDSPNLVKLNFYRADFVKSVVDGYKFEKCNLTHMDAKGCYFKNCEFIDCEFNHTNFADAKFIDCKFIYTKNNDEIKHDNYQNFKSPFEKASFFNTFFKGCEFKNCYMKGIGFRYSFFDECNFINNKNYSVSFEKAIIKNTKFDIFDIRHSAVYGLMIENIEFKQFITRFEKAIQIIGIDEIFKDYNYEIKQDNQNQFFLIFSENKSSNSKIDFEHTLKNLSNKKSLFEQFNIIIINNSLQNTPNEKIKNYLIEINKIFENRMNNLDKIVYGFTKYIYDNFSKLKYNISLEDINLILLFLISKGFLMLNVYEKLIDIGNKLEGTLIEKGIFEIIKKTINSNIVTITLKQENEFTIENLIQNLTKLKNELLQKQLIENYHYKILSISNGSTDILMNFIIPFIAYLYPLTAFNFQIKYDEKIKIKLEFKGEKLISLNKNLLEHLLQLLYKEEES